MEMRNKAVHSNMHKYCIIEDTIYVGEWDLHIGHIVDIINNVGEGAEKIATLRARIEKVRAANEAHCQQCEIAREVVKFLCPPMGGGGLNEGNFDEEIL